MCAGSAPGGGLLISSVTLVLSPMGVSVAVPVTPELSTASSVIGTGVRGTGGRARVNRPVWQWNL
jgi:hypothetical protein